MTDIPNLIASLQAEAAIEAEMAQRPTNRVRPITLRTGAKLRQQPGFLRQGTIATVIGRRGSRYLKDLTKAIRAGDANAVQKACDVALERAEASLRFIEEPFQLASASAIVDVTYGQSFLAKHVVMAETADLAISYAVWSGGEIDEAQFAVSEYPSTVAHDTDVEVLIILVEPQLSEIEKAVLRAVPTELSEIHIHGPSVAWTTVLTIGGTPQHVLQVGGPEPDRDVNRLGFPVRLATRLVGGPFGQQHQQETTVDQRQQQQEDTRQQQQQQQVQQADTKQQQQQQQQQQQDDATKQQQQQQQVRQDNQRQQQAQEQRQQQHQQQQRATEQQQQQQQEVRDQNADRQRDQRQHQQQQERQAQTRARQHQQAQHQHQDARTNQQQEWSKHLGDLMRQGLSFKPFDTERFTTVLDAIDFAAMDATQSVKELLRIREELLKEGLG